MQCRYSWCPRTPIAEDDRFDSQGRFKHGYRLYGPRDVSLCTIHAHADGDERIRIGGDA